MNHRLRIMLQVISLAIVGAAIAMIPKVPRLQRHPDLHVEAVIRLDRGNIDRASVSVNIHGLRPQATASLAFYLPDEAMVRSPLSTRSAIQKMATSAQPHIGGSIVLHFTSWTIKADETGRIKDLQYTTLLGGRAGNQHVGYKPPRYGYIDDHTVATSFDYILPKISCPDCDRLSYNITIDAPSYRINDQLTNRTGVGSLGSRYGSLVAGSFKPMRFPSVNPRIVFWTDLEIPKELQSILEALVASMGQLGISASPINVVGVTPRVQSEGLEILPAKRTILLDTSPITRERLQRLAENVFKLAVLGTGRFKRSDEAWLQYSLPYYLSMKTLFHTLGDEDQWPEEMSMYTMSANRSTIRGALDDFNRLPKIYREYKSHDAGALAIEKLRRLSESRGSTLEALIHRYIGSLIPLPFFDVIRVQLGWAAGSKYWRESVQSDLAGHLDSPKLLTLAEPEPNKTSIPGMPISIYLTGSLDGHIENCGCKVSQSGGAPRRSYYLRHKRKPGDLLFDLGNFLSRLKYDPPDNISAFESTLQERLMARDKYDAIALGINDLARLSSLSSRTLAIATSANVVGPQYTRHVRLKDREFAIIGWSDYDTPATYDNATAVLVAATKADFSIGTLRRVVDEEASLGRHSLIIGYLRPTTIAGLLHSDQSAISAIFTRYPMPASGPRVGYVGRTLVAFVEIGKYGVSHFTGVVANGYIDSPLLFEDPLDPTVAEDTDTKQLITRAFDSEAFQNLVMRNSEVTIRDSQLNAPAGYAGFHQCATCHPSEYEQWSHTGHAAALTTLAGVHREWNPGCVRCHVTGFGYTDGYSIGHRTAELNNVSCEECHGPGATHVRAPRVGNIVKQPTPVTCQRCHDRDHSNFDDQPQRYFTVIAHNPPAR